MKLRKMLTPSVKASVVLFLFAFALIAANTARAAEYFVDCENSDAADTNDEGRGSENLPYKSIQAAVDAAPSGSTIYIAEGVYSNDVPRAVSASNVSLTRVLISGKKLHLIGAGRGKTIVKGVQAATDNRLGAGAARCLAIIGPGAAGTIVEKLTLAEGGTELGTSNTDPVRGGGWFADRREVYFVDCDIVNCAARDGASSWYGTAVRCRFLDNKAPYGTGGSRYTDMVNCAMARCTVGPSTGLLHYGTFVNCTFLMCGGSPIFTNSSKGYNCVILYCATGVTGTGCTAENCVNGNAAPRGSLQLFSPVSDSFVLLDGSDAVGAGLASNLGAVTLPDGVSAAVDLDGKGIVADAEGRINAGAVQLPRTPTSGGFYFKREATYGCDALEIDGKRIVDSGILLFPETYPTQYQVHPVMGAGKHFFRRVRSFNSAQTGSLLSEFTYADMNGDFWLMPPPQAGAVSTNEFQGSVGARWVGGDNASDSNNGLSSAAPFATIQAAISSINGADRTVVYVAPGEYGTEIQTNSVYGLARLSVTGRQVLIKGTGGAAVTSISGAPDPDTLEAGDYPGCGPKAIRCVASSGCQAFCLQGFTLKDGYTDCPTAAEDIKTRGSGAAVIAQSNGVVNDCVVTNCVARRAAVESVYFNRSRVYGCTTWSSTLVGGITSSSYFLNNVNCDNGGAASGVVGADHYQCTIVGARKSGRLNAGTPAYNSIEDGGVNIYSATTGSGLLSYNYTACYAKDEKISPFIRKDPCFVDRERDGHLYAFSPAVAAGDRLTADNYGATFWMYATSDLDGRRLAFSPEGKPTLGAFMTTVKAVSVEIVQPAKGGFELVSGTFGSSFLKEGDEVAFAPAAGTRPCAGVKVNDTPICFTNYPNETIRLGYADIERLGGLGKIEAWYTTDWYVDDDGDDENTGFLPTRPKRRLSSVIALTASGDTVWAADGVYDDGTCDINGLTTKARVNVPMGVTVKSANGPKRTFIFGGEGVRPVYLNGNSLGGSKVSGFTLTGGNVSGSGDDCTGGGVLSNNSQGRHPNFGIVVENCIISNNVATGVGGGAVRCMLVNCQILENRSSQAANSCSAVYQGSAYGCFVDRNVGGDVFNYCAHVIDTVIGVNNVTADGKAANSFNIPGFSPDTTSRIYNSLIAGRINVNAGACEFRNCVLCEGTTSWGSGCVHDDRVVLTNAESLVLSPEGVPVIGRNAAVDRGDLTLNTYFPAGDRDLRGFQRIMNGASDIGCFEADWEPRYAKDLRCARRAAIVTADPSVVETADRTVSVSNATLTVVWKAAEPGEKAVISFRVSGGTLSILRNGVEMGPFAASDDVQTVSFVAAVDEEAFEFVHRTDGEGSAELVSMKANVGLLLLVR